MVMLILTRVGVPGVVWGEQSPCISSAWRSSRKGRLFPSLRDAPAPTSRLRGDHPREGSGHHCPPRTSAILCASEIISPCTSLPPAPNMLEETLKRTIVKEIK